MLSIEFRVKKSKVKRDVEVEVWFPGSRVLCFPLKDIVSHIWTTHGRKMFPIEFGVKRSINRHVPWTLKYEYGFRALE
jgi:hypothetical protein